MEFNSSTQFQVSPHFRDVMKSKGFTADQVIEALGKPYKVTNVSKYPGQKRYCGAGIAVIVDFKRGNPCLVTAYLDGVITPLREDQKNDLDAVNSGRIAIITQKEHA